MAQPAHYKTLAGLLRATDRVCKLDPLQKANDLGMSKAMWLTNAEFVARQKFGDAEAVRAVRRKHAITRPQDLVSPAGGHAVFGMPLPKRDYIIGDNVPGVGTIVDIVDTRHGPQAKIGAQWILMASLGAAS